MKLKKCLCVLLSILMLVSITSGVTVTAQAKSSSIYNTVKNGFWYSDHNVHLYYKFYSGGKVRYANKYGLSSDDFDVSYKITSDKKMTIVDKGTGAGYAYTYLSLSKGKVTAKYYFNTPEGTNEYNGKYTFKKVSTKVTKKNVKKMMMPTLNVYQNCINKCMGVSVYITNSDSIYNNDVIVKNGKTYYEFGYDKSFIKDNINMYLSTDIVKKYYNKKNVTVSDNKSYLYVPSYTTGEFRRYDFDINSIKLISTKGGVYTVTAYCYDANNENMCKYTFKVKSINGILKITSAKKGKSKSMSDTADYDFSLGYTSMADY